MRLPADPVLQGPRIVLRRLRPEDVNGSYVRWMNDPRVTAFLEARFRKHDLAGIREFVAGFEGDDANILFAILLDGSRHIGNIKLGNIDWNHLNADIGLIIGEPDCWNKGIATEAVSLVSGFAFEALGLHKLIAGFYAANAGSQRAFAKAGYVPEGRIKDQFACGGERSDGILMGMIRPAWVRPEWGKT